MRSVSECAELEPRVLRLHEIASNCAMPGLTAPKASVGQRYSDLQSLDDGWHSQGYMDGRDALLQRGILDLSYAGPAEMTVEVAYLTQTRVHRVVLDCFGRTFYGQQRSLTGRQRGGVRPAKPGDMMLVVSRAATNALTVCKSFWRSAGF
jgi:hypothetical protein